MIRGKAVTKAYLDNVLLNKVDFVIGNHKKIGLVGRNGCGKTTLLKLITGEEELTSGNIEKEGDVSAYIPQVIEFPNCLVGEYLESKLSNKWEFYKVEQLVSKLKFENFDPYQELTTLSEGQKMKVKLMEVLLMEPTTLLIDEPTNHLDIQGIMWFEEYIKHLPLTVLMISHDRSFLNHTVDEIWEIEKQSLYKFVGNFDHYKEEKLKLIDKWDTEYKLFLKKKASLDRLLENARKIKDSRKRGNAVQAAKKRIEREVVANKKEKYTVKNITSLNFDTEARAGKLMIRCNHVAKSYGNKNILTDISFELRGNEKIWLLGPNGAGKSTLIKTILGEELTSNGTANVGVNLKVGYFSQKQTELDFKETLFEYFIKETGCYFGQAYGKLNKFMFDKEAVQKRIWQLSPGERSRFKLAIFANQDYDLLIMDEPDNHLDIETKEVLENSLRDYKGGLLLVSHDRYFVERIGIEKALILEDGTLLSL